MPENELTVEKYPDPRDLEFLENQLNSYNIAKTGIDFGGELAIFVRNSEGRIIAGISGFTWGNYTEIKYLWVDEDLRGQGYGSRLLQAAEEEARRRGSRMLYLDIHSFQASDFYPKFGFEAVGVLENCPVEGYKRYFFRKILS
ncbi:MAG TPA: GNAT family N-acetyltransferase [Chloroflexia bacterium]|nr:GNAT family N-acetyltransferase [Chloroflexia bacterium]